MQTIDPPAELALGLRERSLVAVDQPGAGTGDSAAADAFAKLGQNAMCDTHVVGVAEVVLHSPQSFGECSQIILVEKAPQKLDRITEFLGSDTQFVTLRCGQSAEPFATFAHRAPASIEQVRCHFANCRGQSRRSCGVSSAPALCFEPVR